MFNLPNLSSKALLLSGASLAAILITAPAQATTFTGMTGKMASQVPNTAVTKPVSSGAGPNSPNLQPGVQSQSSQDFSSALARIQAQLSAQAAARSTAQAGPNNLGTAAHPLVDVVDGLGPNGLNPVATPKPAAQDTTGLLTWDGASAPTQTTDTNGHADVTIHQTQSRAILSWQSFNVGKNTTLNFDQQGNADWIALNRIVGANASPSQILGNIKADGTVLVINQNGIIFGGSSQVNVHSLIASTLDIGRAVDLTGGDPTKWHALTVQERNQEFAADGLLGYADANNNGQLVSPVDPTFSPSSATKTSSNGFTYAPISGKIEVEDGAQVASGDGGYILLAGPSIQNSGSLSSNQGQVILAAGDQVSLVRATGAPGTAVSEIRGFVPVVTNLQSGATESVVNTSTGLIQAPEGSIILDAPGVSGAAVNSGILSATTSISRNGVIEIGGATIEIAPNSTIAITPSDSDGTIPQDPTSIVDFKSSKILIGAIDSQLGSPANYSALIDIGASSLIFAPSANISIGAIGGPDVYTGTSANSRVFVDSGAIIDAAGLTDIEIPATRNAIQISPLKNNELADDPSYKNSFLNGATVYVDPRLSGVRDDGVAWVGSPLIDAASYAQQVGVSASELMTKGGNVTLGAASYAGSATATDAPNIAIKSGAIVNIAGGWVTYQPGKIQTTKLITSDGRIVDIGSANPNDDYVGIYNGDAVDHPRWAIRDTYTNSLIFGAYYAAGYSEGRDAGSLTLQASAISFDGSVDGGVYAGPLQLAESVIGTVASPIYGDNRALQAAPSQLPTGGFLLVQAEAVNGNTLTLSPPSNTGGADIVVTGDTNHRSLSSNLNYGQTIQVAPDGTVSLPSRDVASYLTASELGTIDLSDALLSNSGFADVSLATSGSVTIKSDATVSLAPGGIFNVLAGRAVTVDGTVSVPSGSISLASFDSRSISAGGSVFSTAPAQVGDFDVVVNGTLSAAGRWVNDFDLDANSIEGAAWLNGGSVTLYAAPRVSSLTNTPDTDGWVSPGTPDAPETATDLSGSILINPGSSIDVSGGGRVDRNGKFALSGTGGNLSLYDETSYYQIAGSGNGYQGSLSGFRVNGLLVGLSGGDVPYVPVNPDKINAHVFIDPDAIRAQGFAGGGTLTLVSPEFAFGNNDGAASTELPLDFVSKAGFANYDITSYKTDLISNPFNNGLGGTDAILATQVLTIGAGQNLNLTQSMLPSILSAAQVTALRNLASGGDLFGILTGGVPDNAWDRKPVNLTLGGLLELDVAQGGSITGEAGAQLTVSQLLNEGTIRLPGGTLRQQEILPVFYTQGALAIHALSDVFSTNADGSIDENAPSRISGQTNIQLVGSGGAIYLLGNLDAGEGVVLASGAETDLSGVSIRDPYATNGPNGALIATGKIVDGGSLVTLPSAALNGRDLYQVGLNSPYSWLSTIQGVSNGITNTPLQVIQVGQALVADPGTTINLSGTSDIYDEPVANRGFVTGGTGYVATPVWSNAGTLSAGADATLAGANILARGGALEAEGGTLVLLDPVLTQQDATTPAANIISADQIATAGFTTLVALGSVGSSGDVTLNLGRGFFLEDRPVVDDGRTIDPDTSAPTIRSGGGALTINAPYIAFDSAFDVLSGPAQGAAGNGTDIFNADEIDVTGALRIDPSVANAEFNASGDMRLTGVAPWQQNYYIGTTPALTLNGQIAANGNLTFTAGQIYPTTGSSFAITSAGADATITFGRAGAPTPDAPYSAGSNLLVQAASIVQGGVIRVPLGTLTLGSSAASAFAPATKNVELMDNSVTSVSANGLVIPYGTTTDQTEWYFTPTNGNPLTAPPEKLLSFNGGDIAIDSGASVDISGGGDIYGYEFVPGTGGSRDVLNQLNPDTFTSKNGYQYPDGRQVYAIVPGLSDAPTAAYDPIYSANYGSLSTATGSGLRVWLNGGKGLTAGWYTLLPAQYALLPGGMRVVEQTGIANVAAGTSLTERDGSLIVSGHYGDALSGASQSQQRLFEVQSQSVIAHESDDIQTTGNAYFASLAKQNGSIAPQLPMDAGRIVINPGATLTVNAVLSTAAADGGRGAQVDIGAAAIDILSSLPATDPNDGTVRVTATSLSNLGADSLLIGGTRTDNDDGTTALNVTANTINVSNESSVPLSAAEIVLAANGGITIADGSAIVATGTLSDSRTGAYEVGSSTTSGSGALLRVANGPERLVMRDNIGDPASLTVGAATLSGNAVLFDSSGANTIDPSLIIQNAKFVALGAPRIGFGADPATYDGLVITGGLERLLTQSGAQLTLRSQSSIDFAGGDYTFGDIRLDAAALSDLDGGNVTIHGNSVSLGNSGAAGIVCTDCSPGGGTLAISAGRILFTGGDIATKSSVLAGDVPVTLSADTTFVLPAGTLLANGEQVLTAPALVTVSGGATLNIAGGTGLVLPAGADGTLNAGTDATFGKGQVIVTAGSYFFPNGYKANFTSGAAGGAFAAGTYSVTNDVTVALPSGAAALLASDAALDTTNFFSGGVTLSASTAVLSQGKGSVLDVGNAPLQIHTPYIGDEAQALPAGTNATVPDLILASLGAVGIDNAGSGTIAAISGVPGGSVTIEGRSVLVSGTDIRGTAGKVAIQAADGITLANGVVIEAPGYTQTFGDSVDPTTQNAPGGSVTLSAANGDIDLGNATLSVGGGNAGTLSLSAPNGTVALASATLNGTAGTGGTGGSFVLDSQGAIDLAALNTKLETDGFTGGFTVATSSGDLILAANESINAGSVSLTADGGTVDIAGSIDTAGVNGGDISLYGRSGVTLENTANINASASGYAGGDTRQAKGGNVTLGTDFITATTNGDGSVSGTSGTISIASGAVVNVAALRSGDRLVPYYANNVEYYDYVQGDQGGTVTLRAPVVLSSSGNTVNVSVASAGSILGASAVNLVGFKRWDLGAVASSGLYSGVTLNGGTVTLNVTAGLDTPNADGSMTVVPGINFLGDKAMPGDPQTLVNFVQGYDVSAAYGSLGGLASQSNFHAQPGMDLTYSGNIILASNWNLGAGVVNQNAATTGGALVMDPALGKLVLNVPAGTTEAQAEAKLLDPAYTSMTYRVGGSVYGEPGVLSLRAGGNLDIKGSITDGFFQFRDQTDPSYLAQVGVVNNSVIFTGDAGCQFFLSCSSTDFASIPDWSTFDPATFDPTSDPIFYQGLSFFDVGDTVGSAAPVVTRAPFSALANTPAALGSFPMGSGAGTSSVPNGGDPIGSAEVFPLLPQSDGTTRVVPSWSYVFAAGADFTGMLPMPSTNPQRTDPSTRASFIVEGTNSYSYTRDGGGTVVSGGLAIATNPDSPLFAIQATDPALSFADWLAQFSTLYSGLSDDAIGAFFFGSTDNGDSPVVDLIYGSQANATPSAASWLGQFIAANGLQAGVGTRNPATGVYNGYSLGDLAGEGTNTTIYMPVYWLKQFYQQFIVPNASVLDATFPCNVCAPGASGAAPVTGYTKSLIRTGTGSIDVAASGNVDLTNGPVAGRQVYLNGSFDGPNTYQVGGTSIYTAGHPVAPATIAIIAPDTGETIDVQIGDVLTNTDNFSNQNGYGYGISTNQDSAPGFLVANPAYLTGGGDISVAAGNSVLGRRDDWEVASIGQGLSHPPSWVGPVDEPWRTGTVGSQTSAAIDPQLFTQGIATLGGGDVSVTAGANVSDMSLIATDSMVTATAASATRTTAALAAFGGGNVRISAGMDILGGQVDVASGEGTLAAGHDIASAGSFNVNVVGIAGAQKIDNLLTLRLTDATILVSANDSIDMQGITSLGVRQHLVQTQAQNSSNIDAYGLYSPRAGVSLLANGDISVTNGSDNTLVSGGGAAVYPGTFQAASLVGDLVINTFNTGVQSGDAAPYVLLTPSPVGQLTLLAGGNIAPTTIAMQDADPGILPGPFSIFQETTDNIILSGIDWSFPGVTSSTSDTTLGLDHKQSPTHAGDSEPVRIAAGTNIGNDTSGLILSVPKQARVYAGQDIINMMFFGQNLASSDITRVAAGRDITATSALTAPVIDPNPLEHGTPEPALLGNTFVIGGPGSFILQAGRNAGPFLNSADVTTLGTGQAFKSANETYGGGVLSVGNEWNPWLPQQGADVSVLFGVAGGMNYDAFRQAYLDPANIAAMPDYLFEQETSDVVSGGITNAIASADRSKPIYGPLLVTWMQANAATALSATYGTTNVSYEQAYAVFAKLPALNQQAFLNKVYFDELKETSDPASQSYLQYARGYTAVNTLFPAADGYTQNDLTGGSNGANTTIQTGNLDLRLATIQTDWGGDITIMGPGGRVLAGSTVRTDQQAARRTFVGDALFNGGIVANSAIYPVAIQAIPSGEEGVLTLRGGDISTFTDGDFLLNQSRVFTENGGNIIMWSSNADLNAGQGPKTSADFPPVVVKVSDDLYSQLDQAGSTSGAGIATLEAYPDAPPSNVYLIAPRGTVDAGDAGIRVSGDFYVAALAVANADNIQVQGKSFGLPPTPVTNLTLTTASTAATQAAQVSNSMKAQQPQTSINVEVTGFGGDINQPDECLSNSVRPCK